MKKLEKKQGKSDKFIMKKRSMLKRFDFNEQSSGLYNGKNKFDRRIMDV